MAAAAKLAAASAGLLCWLPIGGVEDSGQIHSRQRRSFASVPSRGWQPPLAGPAVLICVQPVLRMLLG